MGKKNRTNATPPTVEQVEAAGYTEGAAEKIAAEESGKAERGEYPYDGSVFAEPAGPTFTLCADSEFGFRAMIAIARLFPATAPATFREALREFELYEEANRS